MQDGWLLEIVLNFVWVGRTNLGFTAKKAGVEANKICSDVQMSLKRKVGLFLPGARVIYTTNKQTEVYNQYTHL